ncbi:MAG: competence/damage-inducible protein A [Proteobacteria bacterium]|nr:competence/damage-inducible protein A [Pseudomonadota bacterium]
MTEFDLLQKTELRIQGVRLKGANLNELAAAVARVLDLEPDEVLVTDALGGVVTVDVLRKTVDPYSLVGRRDRLLGRLAELEGVELAEDASICSEGMLGWIALDEDRAREALDLSARMAEEIRANIARRVMVFSTGYEVSAGQIEDTNQPTVVRELEAAGFRVKRGPALDDDADLIAGHLRQAVENGGYALIITTGGVGAEAKDQTIEALRMLDPGAATPYICKFEPGTGRHVKDGVRIGVGRTGGTLIVSLPGPNDEVARSLEVLVPGLASNLEPHELAEAIASRLRADLRHKMKHGHG